jgi:CPA2 family monovalent cation:H+ antiporter-2
VKVVSLVAFTALVCTRVIPVLLDHVAATRSRELFTLTVLVLALGIAVGSALVFEVSMALGAFLAGMVVGRSDYSLRAATEALPMRDAFAVLFFVSVGMLLDPQALAQSPWLIAATLGVVLIGKPLIAFALVLAMRYPIATALSVAVALAQIGEFSFILASLGRDLGIFSPDVTQVLVAVAIISIVLNPVLYRAVAPVGRWLARRTGRPALALETTADTPALRAEADSRHRAVVVGYGPTGRTVARLLAENGVTPTIIDLNMDSIRPLADHGIRAVYGDASHRDTLEQAGVGGASTLILTSAGMAHSEDVIREAREINPAIHVLARTSYLRDVDTLKRAGARDVFAGESEVALAFTESILHRLGATAEQIDRERTRVHEELFGKP